MLLYLWTLPMNVVSWILVRLTRCRQDQIFGDWFLPEGSWLDRLMLKHGILAFTPGSAYIVFRHGVRPNVNLWQHEFTHQEQHCRYGPFFLPVYFWYSLKSKLAGTGWYRGNKLEREARGE